MNHICADIKCPFFTSETEKSIRCEGAVNGSLNTLKFDNDEDKMAYIEKYCTNYPNNCHICKAADAKYA